MAKFMTLAEASTRFQNLASTGIPIEEAIQEAVDSIYDMGRWPGTTYELVIPEADFIAGTEYGEVFLFLDNEAYDGVIGFRNRDMGFAIQDIVSLYRLGINSGDASFIDFGLVDEGGIKKRKYRAPINFQASTQLPMFALMKQQPPVMKSNDAVPIYSVAALKSAVQAVCCEYVSDLERAKYHWEMFDMRMNQSVKQFAGNKQFTMGVDSSLRRRPHQFQ